MALPVSTLLRSAPHSLPAGPPFLHRPLFPRPGCRAPFYLYCTHQLRSAAARALQCNLLVQFAGQEPNDSDEASHTTYRDATVVGGTGRRPQLLGGRRPSRPTGRAGPISSTPLVPRLAVMFNFEPLFLAMQCDSVYVCLTTDGSASAVSFALSFF